MRTLPICLLVGGLFALYVTHEVSARQTPVWPPIVTVDYVPDPNRIVNLIEGTPYTVQRGQRLVIRDIAWGYISTNRVRTVPITARSNARRSDARSLRDLLT